MEPAIFPRSATEFSSADGSSEKKDETRHNSCRGAGPFEKQGNTAVRTFTLHPNAFNVGIHSCQSTGTISRSRASSRATLQQCVDVTCSRGWRWNVEGERGSANLPVGTWQKFRHLLMSGIHFADARTPCLLSISPNYSVVCRFRFVYVSRATSWPKRRAKRKTDNYSAAPVPLSVEIFCISLGEKNVSFRNDFIPYRPIRSFIHRFYISPADHIHVSAIKFFYKFV